MDIEKQLLHSTNKKAKSDTTLNKIDIENQSLIPLINEKTRPFSQQKKKSDKSTTSFPRTEDTDVVLKVEKEVLHLHNGILSMYSPVFKIMLNGGFREGLQKEVELKEKTAMDVIEFFKFFYPDQQQQMIEITNFKTLLAFCQEYQIPWLTNEIEKYLVSSSVYQDKNGFVVENLQGLMLADKYDLKDLANKLLSFRTSLSFNELAKMDGTENLKPETVFKLAVKRIPSIMRPENRDESLSVKDTLEEIYKKNQDQVKESKNNTENSPPESSNLFLEDENSDVLLKVEGEKLYLHSAVLSIYSPVFKDKFQELSPQDGKYMIEINGKKIEYVVEMLKFLYADKFNKITDKTNFEQVLSLCQEYKIEWLTKAIEGYLIKTKKYIQGTSITKLAGLSMCDQYNLNTMRSILLQGTMGTLKELRKNAEYHKLKETTKYELARKRMASLANNKVDGDECVAILQFLDKVFLNQK